MAARDLKRAIYLALDENPEFLETVRRRARLGNMPPTDPQQRFLWDSGYHAAFAEIVSMYEEVNRERTLGRDARHTA